MAGWPGVHARQFGVSDPLDAPLAGSVDERLPACWRDAPASLHRADVALVDAQVSGQGLDAGPTIEDVCEAAHNQSLHHVAITINTFCSDLTATMRSVLDEPVENLVGETPGDRLRAARERAGHASARAAALDRGWPESTYRAHEAGTRNFGEEDAHKYARAFRVHPLWLLHGLTTNQKPTVEVVGYVGAGAALNRFSEGQGPFETVEAPPRASRSTVAVEVRGDSMRGHADNGDVLYYDDRREPVTEDLFGKLCIVGLVNGSVLVKRIQRGSRPGLYHLYSSNLDPIFDQEVEWAAKVKWIKPR
jgi:phage repressor protein C with HTH and peptisase S24 domain